MGLSQFVKSRATHIRSVVGNTAYLLLSSYTALITVASFYAENFWPDQYGNGTDDFIPLTSTSWEYDWSIEEYLCYVILPWVVVYQIKKGQQPA